MEGSPEACGLAVPLLTNVDEIQEAFAGSVRLPDVSSIPEWKSFVVDDVLRVVIVIHLPPFRDAPPVPSTVFPHGRRPARRIADTEDAATEYQIGVKPLGLLQTQRGGLELHRRQDHLGCLAIGSLVWVVPQLGEVAHLEGVQKITADDLIEIRHDPDVCFSHSLVDPYLPYNVPLFDLTDHQFQVGHVLQPVIDDDLRVFGFPKQLRFLEYSNSH
mmetsp:Transcript_18722/g.43339  ORF Transcript_18722/g.43339 Transcript_18722/m.43339 type:complete len:216 (+) Transcript_18722:3776-4423(+)